jgi:aspartate/methionine/tyrosine aminotransferase
VINFVNTTNGLFYSKKLQKHHRRLILKELNPIAESLNKELSSGINVSDFLSHRGKSIYFPSKGILGQSAEARSSSINATIGTAFEEDGSPLTLECVEETVNLASETFLYAPSYGTPKLRDEWEKMLSIKNPGLAGKRYSKPVVTAALTHGLSVAGYLFMDEDQEVILPDLFWDNYELVFCENYGAQLKLYNTFVNGGFDLHALKQCIDDGPVGKKVILLNFPNNPAGYTVTEKEASELCNLLVNSARNGNKLVVILDDAYFGLVYEDGVIRESLFSKLADAHENILAVKLDGPTKEDYVWGLRVGFITFACKDATPAQIKALEDKAAGVVRGSISNASSVSQAILLKSYTNSEYTNQKQMKYEILERRYTMIKRIFAEHPEYKNSFEPVPFNSGYFMCIKPVGVEAEAVRKELLANYSTGVIVLSGLIRIAFSAVPYEKLEQIYANIYEAIKKLQK